MDKIPDDNKTSYWDTIKSIFLKELEQSKFQESDDYQTSCHKFDILVEIADYCVLNKKLKELIYSDAKKIVLNYLEHLSIFKSLKEKFSIVQKIMSLYDFLGDEFMGCTIDLININVPEFNIEIKGNFYVGIDLDIKGRGIWTLRNVKKGRNIILLFRNK